MAAWAGVLVVVSVTWGVLDSWQEQGVCMRSMPACVVAQLGLKVSEGVMLVKGSVQLKSFITKTFLPPWVTWPLLCWLGSSLSLIGCTEGVAKDKKKIIEARHRVRGDEEVSPDPQSTWGVWWYQCLPLAYQHGKCLNNKHSVWGKSNISSRTVCAVNESCDHGGHECPTKL